jgi:glyoxylase-like metal-dependent hydrolase (beta-lactamase superfamily II)
MGVVFTSCHQMMNTLHIEKIKWIHGSQDCDNNTDPPIQVVQYDNNTWILRQNKCLNYEAPFMFLFVGSDKALLMDTGATEDPKRFPLYKTVQAILNEWQRDHENKLELIVAHTHNHNDHRAGDAQFRGKPNTTVVGLKIQEVNAFRNRSL